MNAFEHSSIQVDPREPSNDSEMRSRLGSMRQPQINDYVKLMRNQPTAEDLTKLCISGELRTSSVRGLVWMILLKCVPYSKDDWSSVFSRSRSGYDQLKALHVTDPHMQDSLSHDPCVINPLSDADHNPWKKFFEDGDLRELIAKDVARTFPEMEFFQTDRIRQMLSHILLVYAKENPYISYKQGMHEILAPLLFVLYSDQQTYEHYVENDALSTMDPHEREIIAVVHDDSYLEHDSYMLFSEVMRDVCAWYEDGGSPTTETVSLLQQPFMRVQDGPPTSRLMDELTAINARLQEVDPTLHKHLSSLDIPPQLYGIRWLRLLFGREFPLHDLLFIWDVLFSQQRPLHRFVQCMAVVMLVHVRSLLLSCDYSGCLQYLMRYPPVADVTTFVRLVLHLRHPTKYARPRQDGAASAHYAHITVAGGAHPARAKDAPIVLAREARESGGVATPLPSRPHPHPARQPRGSLLFGARNGERRRPEEGGAAVPHGKRSPANDSDRAKSASPLTPSRSNGADSERRLEQLQEELRERDERMTECARSLKKLSVELQHPSCSSDEKRRDVAERLIQIARHLTLPPPPRMDSSKPLPPVREMQELGANGRVRGAVVVRDGGVADGAARAPGNGVVFHFNRRRTSRLVSSSSTDSTSSADGIVASLNAPGTPSNYTRLQLNRKLQKKVTSCPVLYAPRF
ncbi:rbg-3 [Pristionchus pacificus]|nr:rbg-3 [Pristionchus pacificus]